MYEFLSNYWVWLMAADNIFISLLVGFASVAVALILVIAVAGFLLALIVVAVKVAFFSLAGWCFILLAIVIFAPDVEEQPHQVTNPASISAPADPVTYKE